MEVSLDITMWITLCAVGLLAGFIDAIVGGGGMLTIPTLLTVGLPPHVVLGTNKLAASFGSFTASLTFYRKKLFNPRFWRNTLIFTAIGAVIGTIVVSYISVEILEKSLPLIIVATAIYTLLSKSHADNNHDLPKNDAKLQTKQCIQGSILGFYDGVAGPGTGAFWTASSSAIYKINILLSCGLAKANNFVSNILSLATFIYLGYVNFFIGITLGLFIMLGAWIGAHSAIKFGGKFIRPLFITVVIIMSANLAYQAWF